MILAEQLVKKYGDTEALNIEKLFIKSGESFGLVGNNGAGKTTFFRLILDLIKATNGKVFSKEINVKQSEHWKKYTGSYLDESFLIDFLTPEEYFSFVAKLHGISNDGLNSFYTKYSELFNDEILEKKKYIRDFSRGNQKKIGITAALMPEPEVLILDEPFANLDPSTQIRLKRILKELKDNKGVTVLISSHDLSHVTEVCERIVVLDKGKITRDIETNQDTLKELEAYFKH